MKAILDLAMHYEGGGVVSLADISRRQDIPMKYLEQIMLSLKAAGFVHSKRGVRGGFILARAPAAITVGEVVRLIEGPLEPIACARRLSDSGCGEEACCAFREVWVKVGDALGEILDSITFARIMQRARELQQQSAGYSYQI